MIVCHVINFSCWRCFRRSTSRVTNLVTNVDYSWSCLTDIGQYKIVQKLWKLCNVWKIKNFLTDFRNFHDFHDCHNFHNFHKLLNFQKFWYVTVKSRKVIFRIIISNNILPRLNSNHKKVPRQAGTFSRWSPTEI